MIIRVKFIQVIRVIEVFRVIKVENKYRQWSL